MPQPKLLNPILVEIRQVDTDKTVYKKNHREPANFVRRRTSFKINAQIFFGVQEQVQPAKSKNPDPRNLAGFIEESDGYIIVRKIDLATIGKQLQVGDKLIGYGNSGVETACEYFFIGKKDAAHYSVIGQCTLERWYFKDRK